MKKSRIFMTAATFVLVVSAFFATKANKKFANEYSGTLYYGSSVTNIYGKLAPGCGQSPVLFTVSAGFRPHAVALKCQWYMFGFATGKYITLFSIL
ncbi:MAG TPA: hypothetical protein VF939_12350 [Puia sp.]